MTSVRRFLHHGHIVNIKFLWQIKKRNNNNETTKLVYSSPLYKVSKFLLLYVHLTITFSLTREIAMKICNETLILFYLIFLI